MTTNTSLESRTSRSLPHRYDNSATGPETPRHLDLRAWPEIVSHLEARGIRHVYVDGGITIQRFLQAGLIQRLIVTRVPVLIRAGIPLFGPLLRDIVLRHVETRQYASGPVRSEYAVLV